MLLRISQGRMKVKLSAHAPVSFQGGGLKDEEGSQGGGRGRGGRGSVDICHFFAADNGLTDLTSRFRRTPRSV